MRHNPPTSPAFFPLLQNNSNPTNPTNPPQPSTSYAPRSPTIPSFRGISPQRQNHRSHHHNQQRLGTGHEFPQYDNSQYMPPIPALPQSHTFASAPSGSQFYQPVKAESVYMPNFDGAGGDADYVPSSTMTSRAPRMPRGQAQVASSSMHTMPSSASALKNPNPDNIEIRTKFPVARIKRIMQADEEVGKVAQVTPVAVSKALELFMIALVTGAAAIAKEKGGKRVTAQHLKQVVEGDEQFDFLTEIVGRVGEGQEGAGGETRKRKGDAAKGSDSEEEDKKSKKGRGRKKRPAED
ncbi:hypothetical protein B7494_g3298 [Chlorociboria aeruginascens]|nr:hypothetical protein B7494_g3298 [Chlorociboria aeruginascens]